MTKSKRNKFQAANTEEIYRAKMVKGKHGWLVKGMLFGTILLGSLFMATKSTTLHANEWQVNSAEQISARIAPEQKSLTMISGDTVWNIGVALNIKDPMQLLYDNGYKNGEQYTLQVGTVISWDGNHVTVKDASGTTIGDSIVNDDQKIDDTKTIAGQSSDTPENPATQTKESTTEKTGGQESEEKKPETTPEKPSETEKNDLATLQAKEKEMKEYAELLNNNLATEKDEVAKAEQALADAKASVMDPAKKAELEKELATQQALADKVKTSVDALTEEFNKIVGEAEAVEKKIADLQLESSQLDTTSPDYENEVAKLNEEIATEEQNLKAIQEHAAEVNNTRANTEDELYAAKDEIKKIQDQLATDNSVDLSALETVLATAKQGVANIEQQIVDNQKQLDALSKQILERVLKDAREEASTTINSLTYLAPAEKAAAVAQVNSAQSAEEIDKVVAQAQVNNSNAKVVAEKKAAEEQAAKDKAEAEKKAAEEQAAKDKVEAEKKAAEEQAAKEKAEAEKKAAEEQAAKEKAEAEKKAAEEQAAKEKAEAEKKAAEEQAAKEKAEAEKKAAEEQAAKEKAEAEKKAAEEQAAKDKAEAEKIAAEEAAKALQDAKTSALTELAKLNLKDEAKTFEAKVNDAQSIEDVQTVVENAKSVSAANDQIDKEAQDAKDKEAKALADAKAQAVIEVAKLNLKDKAATVAANIAKATTLEEVQKVVDDAKTISATNDEADKAAQDAKDKEEQAAKDAQIAKELSDAKTAALATLGTYNLKDQLADFQQQINAAEKIDEVQPILDDAKSVSDVNDKADQDANDKANAEQKAKEEAEQVAKALQDAKDVATSTVSGLNYIARDKMNDYVQQILNAKTIEEVQQLAADAQKADDEAKANVEAGEAEKELNQYKSSAVTSIAGLYLKERMTEFNDKIMAAKSFDEVDAIVKEAGELSDQNLEADKKAQEEADQKEKEQAAAKVLQDAKDAALAQMATLNLTDTQIANATKDINEATETGTIDAIIEALTESSAVNDEADKAKEEAEKEQAAKEQAAKELHAEKGKAIAELNTLNLKDQKQALIDQVNGETVIQNIEDILTAARVLSTENDAADKKAQEEADAKNGTATLTISCFDKATLELVDTITKTVPVGDYSFTMEELGFGDLNYISGSLSGTIAKDQNKTIAIYVEAHPNVLLDAYTGEVNQAEVDKIAGAFLAGLNEYRASLNLGLGELKLDEHAQKAADIRAKELLTNFGHIRPNGELATTIIPEIGYSSTVTAECLAKGSYARLSGEGAAADVLQDWINHEAHNLILMRIDVTSIGIGIAFDEYGVAYISLILTDDLRVDTAEFN